MLLVHLALIALPHASAQWSDGFTQPVNKPISAPTRPTGSAGQQPPPIAQSPQNGVCQSTGNPLEGKPLRYLIGGGAGSGSEDAVTEVSYSTNTPVKNGISIAYCNLFDETNSGKYGPYLSDSDTAQKYNEGKINPKGPGWRENLRDQFDRRKKAGFEYIELDNPDAYKPEDVIEAYNLAAAPPYNFKIIAKNPKMSDKGYDNRKVVAHPAVVGIIVERGSGSDPATYDKLRKDAGKPNIPVWFVGYGGGKGWTNSIAGAAQKYCNMGVTYSSAGEYGNAIDVTKPKPVQQAPRGPAPETTGTGVR